MIKQLYGPLKLDQLPEKIYAIYFTKRNEPLFHSLQIDGQTIPIFRLVLDLKKTYQPLFKKMHLTEYAKGFLEGVKYQFAPTIDTPENKKELILNEVANGSQFGFPERVKNIKSWEKYFDKKDVYEYGFRVGKIYKAWSIIFETPKYFESGFSDITTPENVQLDSNKKKEPTHLQLALAYCYMVEADVVKAFDYWEGGKEAAYKKVIADYKPKAGKTAWKEFQQTYTNVQRENRKTLCDGGAKNFTVVCELLEQYPKALTIAKKELQ